MVLKISLPLLKERVLGWEQEGQGHVEEEEEEEYLDASVFLERKGSFIFLPISL